MMKMNNYFKVTVALLLSVSLAGCGAVAADQKNGDSSGVAGRTEEVRTNAGDTEYIHTGKEYTAEYHEDMYQVAGYTEEIQDSIKKIESSTKEDSISYIFLTDTHLGYDGRSSAEQSAQAIYRQLYAAVDVANHSDVDFICIGGDIQNGYCLGESKKQEAIDYIQSVSDILKLSEKPVFLVKGNHDDNSQTAQIDETLVYDPEYILSIDEWYQATMANFPQYTTDYHNGYYYYDLPGKNVRVVCLNMVDVDDSIVDGRRTEMGLFHYGYKDEQIEWMLNSAFTREDCQYVVLSHDAFHDSSVSYENKDIVQSLMKAMYTHTEFSSDKFSKNFGQWNAAIKILQSGHMHHERVEQYESIGGLPVVTTDCAVVMYYEGYPMSWAKGYTREQDRTIGTITEALFDITVINDQQYEFIRFGAGEDRELTVK